MFLCLSELHEGKKIGEAEHLERPRLIHTEQCVMAKDTLYNPLNKKGCVNIDIHDRVCRGRANRRVYRYLLIGEQTVRNTTCRNFFFISE